MKCLSYPGSGFFSQKATDLIFSGLHGYCHEFVATMNEQQQRDIMTKSIDVLTEFTGKKPKGWTAPAWNTSRQTIKILEDFGIVSQDIKHM